MVKNFIPYSPMEIRVLNSIPEDGTKINTLEITEIVYAGRRAPFRARQSVLDCTRSLIEKSDLNQESWEIFRSTHLGAQPIYFWREPRKSLASNKSKMEIAS